MHRTCGIVLLALIANEWNISKVTEAHPANEGQGRLNQAAPPSTDTLVHIQQSGEGTYNGDASFPDTRDAHPDSRDVTDDGPEREATEPAASHTRYAQKAIKKGTGYIEGTAYVRDLTIKQTRFVTSHEHPALLPVEVIGEGGHVTRMALQRNTRFPDDISVEFQDESLSATPSAEHVAFYQDPNIQAAITVIAEEKGKRYMGSYVSEGVEYEIVPATGKDLEKRGLREDNDGYIAHIIRRWPNKAVLPLSRRDILEKRNVTRRQAGELNFEIELQYVFDYMVYGRWVQEMGSHGAAVQQMKIVYGSYMNQVDMMYSSISEGGAGFAVHIMPWPFIIQTSKAESWTSGSIIRYLNGGNTDADALIDADVVKRKIGEFVYQRGLDGSPVPDHIQVWTGFTIGSETQTNILGSAWMSSVCSYDFVSQLYYGVSVVKDRQYLVAKTSAHELAHNLGAYHDNVECNGENLNYDFIMATDDTYIPLDGDTGFRFSACSIRQMRDVLTDPQSERRCVKSTACSKVWKPPSPHYTPASLPGEGTALEDYCQIYRGPTAYKCGSRFNDCNELYCQRPGDSRCTSEGGKRPADGASCDSGKMCIQGYCRTKAEYVQQQRKYDMKRYLQSCVDTANGDVPSPTNHVTNTTPHVPEEEECTADTADWCVDLDPSNPHDRDLCNRQDVQESFCCITCTKHIWQRR